MVIQTGNILSNDRVREGSACNEKRTIAHPIFVGGHDKAVFVQQVAVEVFVLKANEPNAT